MNFTDPTTRKTNKTKIGKIKNKRRKFLLPNVETFINATTQPIKYKNISMSSEKFVLIKWELDIQWSYSESIDAET